MEKGYISFVLHAHLPFVRYTKYEHVLEENWLYEAVSESFLPLLRMFHRLEEDNVPFKIVLSLSPTICAMLDDDLLQKRMVLHLENQIALGEKERVRVKDDPQRLKLAEMYLERYTQNLFDYSETYSCQITKVFKEMQKRGRMDIITSSATHSFLPSFQEFPRAVEAQVETAVISHARTFGVEPKGMWLPECGFFPGLETYLKQNNIKYFFAAANGVLHASRKPKYGPYAPLRCPNGTFAFGLDIHAHRTVAGADNGYPADLSYRAFDRDVGFEQSEEYLGPFIYNNGARANTGYKYYAKSHKDGENQLYNLDSAMAKTEEHSDNYIYKRLKLNKKLTPRMDRPPISVNAFDIELFGRWWFEGPEWLETTIRKIAKEDRLEVITPEIYLERHPANQVSLPSFSSLGNNGYAEVWVNSKNDWVYRHLHKAVDRIQELVDRYPDEKGLKEWVLNQAAREVLLSQASDWPFIMKMGSTVPYATMRVKEHLYNFTKIYDDLCRNTVSTEWVTRIEKRNNLFPDLDYRIFKAKK